MKVQTVCYIHHGLPWVPSLMPGIFVAPGGARLPERMLIDFEAETIVWMLWPIGG